jgi:D-sedoheptulose 7-phosphate isomerase
MTTLLQRIARDHALAVDGFLSNESTSLVALAATCGEAIAGGRKLMFCGNGGSACDAMHIAGEFVGRFVEDRRALPALALSADSGIITAVANDYAYEQVFSRQVEALGQAGDVLVAMSTSGHSPNIIKALSAARAQGITTALLTGEKYRNKPPVDVDFVLVVPSAITAHVQEAHMVALHALATLIEADLPQIA